MKPRSLVALSILLLLTLLAACTSRDSSLLDGLRGRRLLPDAGPALSGRGNLNAWFIDAQTVAGYHEAFAFRSDNGFRSLTAFSQGIMPGDTVPFEGYVLRPSRRDNQLVIEESLDYGLNFRSWLTLPVDGMVPRLTYEGFWFDGFQQGWYAVYQDSSAGSPPSLTLRRAQGTFTSRAATLLWADQQVEQLLFTADSVGWVLLRPRVEQATLAWSIAYSEPGGGTWSEAFSVPTMPNSLATPQLAGCRQAAILGWPDAEVAWTFDRRDQTWQAQAFAGAQGTVVAATGEAVLFAAAQTSEDDWGRIATLWRSEDGGQNWQQPGAQEIYADRLRFLPGNPNLCLAYSRDILQISRDRGQTWALLGFPL
jgi:hypothetical protein